jgi:CubicO group peptidase (beta-lactamase class C family)
MTTDHGRPDTRLACAGRSKRTALSSATARAVVLAGLVAVAAVSIAAQGSGPGAVARAFFDALASGSAERFEAMAKERYAAPLLERRTPQERAEFVARIRDDFGTLTLGGIRNVNDEQLTLQVRGSSGFEGRIELTVEAGAPHRITAVRVEAGEREDTTSALPAPPIDGGMDAAALSAVLDPYLDARAAAGEFSGVVAIARDGRTVYEKAVGLADREAGIANATGTRFNVASIGKAFTRTAIAQLVAAGRLSFGDTLGVLIPDYPKEISRAATVQQLLTHQGGIADFFGPEFDAAPKASFASNGDYYRFVSSRPALFAPGAKRDYCNGCYVVLGEIVERLGGQRYEEYVAEHVFAPAGMKTAGFLRADRPSADRAEQYSRRLGADHTLQNAREAHGVAGSAAGGCYATAADLLAFDAAMRSGRLLDPKMTAWFLGGEIPAAGERAAGAYGIAGGAPGTNALLDADATWAVAVVGNFDPPAAVQLGQALRQRLSR